MVVTALCAMSSDPMTDRPVGGAQSITDHQTFPRNRQSRSKQVPPISDNDDVLCQPSGKHNSTGQLTLLLLLLALAAAGSCCCWLLLLLLLLHMSALSWTPFVPAPVVDAPVLCAFNVRRRLAVSSPPTYFPAQLCRLDREVYR